MNFTEWAGGLADTWVPLVLTLSATAVLLFLSVRWWLHQHSGRVLANRRAEQLLRERLTPEQYNQLAKFGYLDIPSRLDPYRQFRIPRTRGRVLVLHNCSIGGTVLSRKVAELCVVSSEPVPDADMVLIHKLMIEADEANYLATANWTRPPHESWSREPATLRS
ncbi:MAG: hypothetical protein DCC55_22290 [Chloroflexi bacterium]|nr:MAG: hypothetical protein DCC55_22290 [Chloroflexota bacterium]